MDQHRILILKKELLRYIRSFLLFSQVAVSLHRHPLLLMIPATIACSYAFMLPIATPPNAIAYSTGYFKMTDMARPGMVMNVIGIGLLAAFVPTLGENWVVVAL